MSKQLLFSVTLADCKVTTFCVGGPGGSGKDTSNTGVRVEHRPTGAVGEGREHRSQRQNKIAAFRRMAETPTFKTYVKQRAARLNPKEIEEKVDRWMDPANLVVEVRNSEGRWERLV